MKGHWVLRTVTLAKVGRVKGHWLRKNVALSKARPNERTFGTEDSHVIKGKAE